MHTGSSNPQFEEIAIQGILGNSLRVKWRQRLFRLLCLTISGPGQILNEFLLFPYIHVPNYILGNRAIEIP
jgi:hypothetical protein